MVVCYMCPCFSANFISDVYDSYCCRRTGVLDYSWQQKQYSKLATFVQGLLLALASVVKDIRKLQLHEQFTGYACMPETSKSMSTVDFYSASPHPHLMRYMQSVFSE